MYAWAIRGATQALVDAWKKLRNPKAHGSAMGEEQSGHDLYFSVIELMYRIIASAIGYDGPILPTSRRRWSDEGHGETAAI